MVEQQSQNLNLITKIKEMLVSFGKDTGSYKFQIANLTLEILSLADHYSVHKKEHKCSFLSQKNKINSCSF